MIDALHGFPKGAIYDGFIETLEDRFGDQRLAAVYRSQLKTRTQGVGELLQEFATTVVQGAHCAQLALPEDLIRRETVELFADLVEGPVFKILLLLGGEKEVNEIFKQALHL
jgi:hypothetical protein